MNAANDTPVFDIGCAGCQWFNPLPGRTDAGECRADRPVPVVVPTKAMDRMGQPMGYEIQVCFPTVPATLWCGRYLPKKAQLPATQEQPTQDIALS